MPSTPPVLPCPYNPAYECRATGDARPPDGAAAAADPTLRCPPGYLPHLKREPVILQGKRVVTGKPPQRRPDSPDDSADDADGAPRRQGPAQ